MTMSMITNEHVVAEASCSHEWAVYSTVFDKWYLKLQCTICGQHAVVETTEGEWEDADHTLQQPYVWHDMSRVQLLPHISAPYVARTADGELERVPREVISKLRQITEAEARHLLSLIPEIEHGEMTSEQFVLYIYKTSNWFEVPTTPALAALCDRFRELSRAGTVLPTESVINAIRWYAAEGVNGEVA